MFAIDTDEKAIRKYMSLKFTESSRARKRTKF